MLLISELSFVPVQSSMATEYAYDQSANALYIRFTRGKLYRYDGFLPSDLDALRAAASFGNHFGSVIRSSFTGIAVTE